MRYKFRIIVLTLLGGALSAFAQQTGRYTIHGHVTDAQSGETLIYATIVSGQEGAVTNEFGFYSITLPEGEVGLTFSYIGYETVTKTISLSRDVVLNVSMRPGVELEASTVVGRPHTGVHATRAGSMELSRDLIKITPVLLGESDVLKTIQLLPGVQSGSDGFSGIFVRGGGDDENLFLLDGVPLYNPVHAFGLFSVFTPDAVKKVTFYKGDFPARFAGRASSIVDVRTVDGNMNKIRGSISVGLVSDKLHLEGPLYKGKTSFSVTGRAVHTLFVSPLMKTKESETNYYFYDFNGKISHKFSDRDRLFLGVYSGRDYFKDHSFSEETDKYNVYNSYTVSTDMNWGNHMASVRWNHIFGGRLFSNSTVFINKYSGDTHSYNDFRRMDPHDGTWFSSDDYHYLSGVLDYGVKTDFDWTPAPSHSVRLGASAIRHIFSPENVSSMTETIDRLNPERDTTSILKKSSEFVGGEFGLYAEDDFSVGDHLRINAGMHVALFSTQGKKYFRPQPRLAFRYDFDGGYAVKAGYSRMSQYIHRLSSRAISMPSDNWVPITKNVRPLTTDLFNAGVLWTGMKGWEFTLDGFYKMSDSVVEPLDAKSVETGAEDWDKNVAQGNGLSYGVEILARKTEGKTTGWIAYTLSKTTRVFPDGSINNGQAYPFRYDRRHVIIVCANSKLSERVTLSAVWNYASGQVVSMPTRVLTYYNQDGLERVGFYIPSRGNYRLAPDHRLDLSVSLTNHMKRGVGVWNFGVYNVYAHKNTLSLDYEIKGDIYRDSSREPLGYFAKLKIKKLSALLFIPSVSYTYSF